MDVESLLGSGLLALRSGSLRPIAILLAWPAGVGLRVILLLCSSSARFCVEKHPKLSDIATANLM
jgi:hypothetical protein